MNINDEKVLQLDKGTLIDVREKEEWDGGHLPNAIHAPLMGLVMNPETFLKNGKNEKYYIYCLSGGRSASACSKLESMGYDVENIGGVMQYTGELVK